MKDVQSRSRISLFLVASVTLVMTVTFVGACSNEVAAPHGAPILTKVYWSTGDTQYLVWSKDPDTALVGLPVPPFATEVDFVFDRRLDGAQIEDIVTVDGVTVARPKAPPPVQASWPDMATAMTDPPFALVVDYNSAPQFGGTTSFVYARPLVPGFPSGDTVSFHLVSGRFTSAYGEEAILPDSIPVKTAALSVSIATSTSAVVPSFRVPLGFNNRLPAPPAQSPFVHVTMNGAEVPYQLQADATLPSRWFLAAATCLGGVWPGSATLVVTIDAGFPDAFGGKLAAPATATFSTSASTGVTPDASCSIPDAGAPDAAYDGPEAGAPDAGVDAATDAASDAG